MNIILSAAEIAALFKQQPTTAQDGGFQSLMVQLQQKTSASTGSLFLSTSDLERIPRYAFDYGNGGWEDRLVTIFGRHLGARLGR